MVYTPSKLASRCAGRARCCPRSNRSLARSRHWPTDGVFTGGVFTEGVFTESVFTEGCDALRLHGVVTSARSTPCQTAVGQ